MKLIKLTKGYFTKVDSEDYEELNKFKWFAAVRNHTVYAARNNKKGQKPRQIFMQNAILKISKPFLADHIDHNGLNNQKSNLRKCTYSENLRNRVSNKTSSSKYLGVSICRTRNKWKSQLMINKKHVFSKRFNTELEAAAAYNEQAIKFFGEFANLNQIPS